jgi:hypothetical protein
MTNLTESISGALGDLSGLTVFSGLKKDPLVNAFRNLLEILDTKDIHDRGANLPWKARSGIVREILAAWADFVKALTDFRPEGDYSFYAALAFLTMVSENPFTMAAEHSVFENEALVRAGDLSNAFDIPALLAVTATGDLSRLGRIAAFDISALAVYIASFLRASGMEDQAMLVEAEGKVINPAGASETRPAPPPGATATITTGFPGDEAAGGIADFNFRSVWAETAAAVFPEGTPWAASLPAYVKYLRGHGAGALGLYQAFRWVMEDGKGKPRPSVEFNPMSLSDLSGSGDRRSLVISNTQNFLEGKPARNLFLCGPGVANPLLVKAVCRKYAGRGLRLIELSGETLDCLPAAAEYLSRRGLKFVVFIEGFWDGGGLFPPLPSLPSNTVIYAASGGRPAEEQLSLAENHGFTLVIEPPGM